MALDAVECTDSLTLYGPFSSIFSATPYRTRRRKVPVICASKSFRQTCGGTRMKHRHLAGYLPTGYLPTGGSKSWSQLPNGRYIYLAPRAHRNGPHVPHCLTNLFLSLCSFLQEIHLCSSKIFVSQSLSPSFESHCPNSYIAHDTCTLHNSSTPYQSGILIGQLIRTWTVKAHSCTLFPSMQRKA